MSNFEEQKEKLYELLGTGTISSSTYLVSNPFAGISNERLDGVLTKDIFWQIFFVTCIKYYERVASIVAAAEMSDTNTVFITGFRGSGKTTFIRYVETLIDGKEKLFKFKYPNDITKEEKKELLEIMNSILVLFRTL